MNIYLFRQPTGTVFLSGDKLEPLGCPFKGSALLIETDKQRAKMVAVLFKATAKKHPAKSLDELKQYMRRAGLRFYCYSEPTSTPANVNLSFVDIDADDGPIRYPVRMSWN